MRQPNAPRKTPVKKVWIFFLFAAAAVFIFRKAVFLAALKMACSFFFSGKHSSFTYERMYWDDDLIRINGMHFAHTDADVLIPDVDLAISGTLFSWKLNCRVFHPEIHVKPVSKTDGGFLRFLFASHFSILSWEVYDGVVHLEDNPPLYFSFLPDDEGQTVGKIALSYEPIEQSLPLFTALLEKKDGALKVDFSLIEEDTSRLLPIALAIFPEFPKQWEQTRGRVEASGTFCLGQEGRLRDLSCQWHIEDLALESRSSGIELFAVQLIGTFASDHLFPLDRLWQSGKGNMLLQEAHFQFASLFPHQLYRSYLKNREFDKEVPQKFYLEQMTIAERQGMSEEKNFEAKPTWSKPDFSSSFGISIEDGQIVLEPDHEPYIHLTGKLCREDQCLPFSIHAEGMVHTDASFFLGLKAEVQSKEERTVQLEGSICRFEEKKYAVEMHFTDLLFEHIAFFSPFSLSKEYWVDGAVDGKAVLLYQNDEIEVEGEINYGDEKLTAGAFFNRKGQLEEGWFETERATEQTYAPFLRVLFPDFGLTGHLQLKGNFDPFYLILSLQGSALSLHHAYGDLSVSHFGENGAELIYDLKEKKIKGEIPIHDAQCTFQNVKLDSLQAHVNIDGNSLHVPSFAAVYKNRDIEGSIASIALDRSKLHIEKGKLQWKMPDAVPYALSIVSCDVDWKEDIWANFHLILQRAQERVLECAGAAQRKAEMGWEIAFDRHRTRFLDMALNISGCQISKGDRIALEMHPAFSCEELSSTLHWLNEANFLSSPNDELLKNCHGMLQTSLSTQDLQNWSFTIQSKDLAYKGKKIAPFLLSGRYLPPESIEIDSCSGDGFSVKAHVALQNQILQISDIDGVIKGISVHAAGKINLLNAAFDLSIDSMAGSTAAFASANQMSGHFAAHGKIQGILNPPLRFSGDAICTFDLSSPLGLTVWNVKPLKLTYAYDTGLCIADLSAYLKSKKENLVLGSISCEVCRIPSPFDEIYAQSVRCSMDPLLLKNFSHAHLLPLFASTFTCSDKLEATGDLQIRRDGFSCLASLKDGIYGIEGHALSLEKVGIQAKSGVFTLQAKTKIGEQQVWGALNIALTKNPRGILRITDHPQAEGIRLHFRAIDDQLHWEKIHGSCLGLHCELVKNSSKKTPGATVLSGNVGFDPAEWPSLFSKAISEKFASLKPGKGYKWQGDLILWQDVMLGRGFHIAGEITGKDWELLGYRFKTLRAWLEAHPTRISLSNIYVDDEAGSIAIKKVNIEKNEQWELSIPIVSVREWHPSSMKKIDASAKGVKPFLIRNFTLSNIHAFLEKPESLQGKGKLTFTNQSKKESTLLDTPIEMIKNFGLDPGLLTPIQGEIDFDLQGDKMYLVGLKDMFSEAKRSEFYLAPGRELSYIDLDGKMHINLKMRQDVMLKITEPFVLTIRGTLENPRYGLDLGRALP